MFTPVDPLFWARCAPPKKNKICYIAIIRLQRNPSPTFFCSLFFFLRYFLKLMIALRWFFEWGVIRRRNIFPGLENVSCLVETVLTIHTNTITRVPPFGWSLLFWLPRLLPLCSDCSVYSLSRADGEGEHSDGRPESKVRPLQQQGVSTMLFCRVRMNVAVERGSITIHK